MLPEKIKEDLWRKRLEQMFHNKEFKKVLSYCARRLEDNTSIDAQTKSYVLYHMGMANRFLENFDEAKRLYQLAIDCDPENAHAFFGLGIVHQLLEEYSESEKCLAHAIQESKKHGENVYLFWNSLGLTYRKMEAFEQAVEAYEQAIGELLENRYAYLKSKNSHYPKIELTPFKEKMWARYIFMIMKDDAKDDGFQRISMESKILEYIAADDVSEFQFGSRLPFVWHDVETGFKGSSSTIQPLTKEYPMREYDYHDELFIERDGGRMYFPKFFAALKSELQSDLDYAICCNNLATACLGTNEKERALRAFRESVEFTPEGVDYPPPKQYLAELSD